MRKIPLISNTKEMSNTVLKKIDSKAALVLFVDRCNKVFCYRCCWPLLLEAMAVLVKSEDDDDEDEVVLVKTGSIS